MIKKLKLLNLLELSKEKKVIEHNLQKNLGLDFIQKALDLDELFEVHEIVFEAVNQGLMSGKINYTSNVLKVI